MEKKPELVVKWFASGSSRNKELIYGRQISTGWRLKPVLARLEPLAGTKAHRLYLIPAGATSQY